MKPQIQIYTDGACSGNPGSGGWGAVILRNGKCLEISGGEVNTTNNRQELTAAIKALELIAEYRPDESIAVTTDSQYVKQGITTWIHSWKAKDWKGSNRKPVKNIDLWQRLDALNCALSVTWEWVRGHSGHPENERADQLAVTAIPQG